MANNTFSQPTLRRLSEELSSNEIFKKEVSITVAKIIMEQKDTFRSSFAPTGLMNFLSNKKSAGEIVGKVLGKTSSEKNDRERKVKEKKTYSAFFSRVPPKVTVPLKKGDSVTDIVSKLYTLLDKSFERKKKEDKEQKKLEKIQQKKKEENNKKLLKSLASTGGGLGGTKQTSDFPWMGLIAGLGALTIPNIDFAGIVKGFDPSKIMSEAKESLKGFLGKAAEGAIPFAVSGITKSVGKLWDKLKSGVDKTWKGAKKLTNKFKDIVTPKEPAKTGPKSEGGKKTPTKTPKRGTASKAAKGAGMKPKVTPPPPPPPVSPPPATKTPKPTASKFSKIAENAKGISEYFGKITKVIKGVGKVGTLAAKYLPFEQAALDIVAALSEYDRDQDENKLKKNVSGIIGGLLGGLASGRALGLFGGVLGSILGPLGSWGGNLLGNVVGGMVGEELGRKTGELIYDSHLLDGTIDLPMLSDENIKSISSAVHKVSDMFGLETADKKLHEFENDIGQKAGEFMWNAGEKAINSAVTGATDAVKSIFEAKTETATIIADKLDIGDAINNAQRTQSDLSQQQNTSSLSTTQNTIALKGQGQTESLGGDISATHNEFEHQIENFKRIYAQ